MPITCYNLTIIYEKVVYYMGFKNLLMSHNKVYKETASYYHMKNPQMNERYYDNYMDYKIMPSLHVFKEDILISAKSKKTIRMTMPWYFSLNKCPFQLTYKSI